MDKTFNSRLQTFMQTFGRDGAFGPEKSQDRADSVIHEYFVAETARSIFDKRKKMALEQMKELDTLHEIEKAVADAAKHRIGSSVTLFETQNFQVALTVKAPAEKFDKKVMINALVKAGVDDDIISKAVEAATTTNKPAETYQVVLRTL